MLKHGKIIENAGEKGAIMHLFGHIGNDINGDVFAQELKYLSNSGIKNCNIKINSVGGNVFQGYSILAGIEEMKAKDIEITTSNVGVAYSVASIILSAGVKRETYDYATAMIHDPFFRNQETEKNELLGKVKDSLRMVLVNNTNMEDEVAKDLMQKETTFNSTEMKKAGLIDKIIKTGRNVNKNVSNSMELMNACTEIYNLNNNKKSMKKVTDVLGMNAEANEDAIFNSVSTLIEKTKTVDNLMNEKTVLSSKVDALESEVQTLKSEAVRKDATLLVENSIKDGKLKETAKAVWIENAVKDFDGTKSLLEGLNIVPESINNGLEQDLKGDESLAKKYAEMIETPELMDSLPKDELKKMEEAYFRGNTQKVETEKVTN